MQQPQPAADFLQLLPSHRGNLRDLISCVHCLGVKLGVLAYEVLYFTETVCLYQLAHIYSIEKRRHFRKLTSQNLPEI